MGTKLPKKRFFPREIEKWGDFDIFFMYMPTTYYSPPLPKAEQANAFSCKELTEFLIQNHISEVEIIGIDGNSCIAASARGAKELGYQVSLPLECIGIHNNLRFQKTRQMPVEKGINIYTTTP